VRFSNKYWRMGVLTKRTLDDQAAQGREGETGSSATGVFIPWAVVACHSASMGIEQGLYTTLAVASI
jgi:hypothetical protein